MIEAINKPIHRNILSHKAYKYIDLRKVELDVDVDHHSKLLNRDPAFLGTLMDRGAATASDFWTREKTAATPVSDCEKKDTFNWIRYSADQKNQEQLQCIFTDQFHLAP